MASTGLQQIACPYCLCAIATGETAFTCPACGFAHHRECWDHLGGCAVEGCSKMVEVKKADLSSTFWGQTEKVCPMCAEKIPVAALQCPYCMASFTDMKPVTREDLLIQPEDPAIKINRKRAVWLLIFSLLGITSPIALLVGWIWYARRRNEIQRSANTRALVLASLGICIAYLGLSFIGLLVYTVAH